LNHSKITGSRKAINPLGLESKFWHYAISLIYLKGKITFYQNITDKKDINSHNWVFLSTACAYLNKNFH